MACTLSVRQRQECVGTTAFGREPTQSQRSQKLRSAPQIKASEADSLTVLSPISRRICVLLKMPALYTAQYFKPLESKLFGPSGQPQVRDVTQPHWSSACAICTASQVVSLSAPNLLARSIQATKAGIAVTGFVRSDGAVTAQTTLMPRIEWGLSSLTDSRKARAKRKDGPCWPVILRQAFAHSQGGLQTLLGRTDPQEALRWLTGVATTGFIFAKHKSFADKIEQLLVYTQQGEAVIVHTSARHALAVIGASDVPDAKMLRLLDPRGGERIYGFDASRPGHVFTHRDDDLVAFSTTVGLAKKEEEARRAGATRLKFWPVTKV